MRMSRFIARFLFCLGLIFMLPACLQDRASELRPKVTVPASGTKKIPMHAAVVMPDHVSGYVWKGNVTGSFVGSARQAIIPLGSGLKIATAVACQAMFRKCDVVKSAPTSSGYQIVIVPSVKKYEYRWGAIGWGSVSVHGSVILSAQFMDDGRLLLTKDYSAKFQGETVTGNDMGPAHASAAEGSIAKAVEAMFADIEKEEVLVATVAKARRQRQSEMAAILGNLRAMNASYRVIVEEAVVREGPRENTYRVDIYPMGSVVHIIGRLDDGWLQVARDGKPFGWVYEASLRAEGNVGGGGGGASTADKKPTIYVAYPKGNEKVAEDAIEFIGYVSSENRTDRLEVLVNNRRVRVDRLWSEFKVAPKGLRGYPIRWRVPLNPGRNKINVNVLDQEGFLVNKAVIVERIEIAETPAPASMADLPPRLGDLAVAQQTADINTENFMSILGDWVKETAKSDYNKGNTMFDQGRFARAAYYYRKSVKTEPLGQAWFNLGLAQKALGNADSEHNAYTEACTMNVQAACVMIN